MDLLTKSAARNIFYGGSAFFFLAFVGLVADSYRQRRAIEVAHPITSDVVAGKRIWERHACFDCHTLFGEGARYAPEIGKVWLKYGGANDPKGATEALKGWFAGQPTGIDDRHQMPNFHFNDKELDDVIAFLRWTSAVDTQGWPAQPKP